MPDNVQSPSSPAPPSPTLKVSPGTAELEGGDVLAFSVAPAGLLVDWSTDPPLLGTIDVHGIYRAPDQVDHLRSLVVLAKTPGGAQYGTAAVTLSDAPRAISRLGRFAVVVAVAVGIGLIVFWHVLNVAPRQPMVAVAPPVVTLDPEKDQSFSFGAIVFGDLKNSVTWSASDDGIDGNGVYKRAKKTVSAPIVVTITATSVTDPNVKDSAFVHLIPNQKDLVVQPSSVSVFTSQQVFFRTDSSNAVSWSRSRKELGLIDATTGVYTAPGFVQHTEPFQITATDPKTGARAAAVVTVNAPFANRFATDWRLLVFVMLMGALGSMLYFSSSFVAYVGNRTFRSSWLWFYIARPFVGGALAIIFFFIAGSGFLNSSASATNLMTIGVIAALVGLFSDRAVRKLSDIFDVVVATKDDRTDKLEQGKPAGKAGAAATNPPQGASPKITSTDPPLLARSQAATLTVKGANFNNYKVSVNDGPEVDPEQPTHESFQIALTAEQTKADKVTITVINGDKTSGPFDVKTAVAGHSIPTSKPKITATDPPILPKNQAAVLAVTGTGFKDYKVQIDGGPATPQDPAADGFKVALAAGQTKGDKITITVVNGDGSLDTFGVKIA